MTSINKLDFTSNNCPQSDTVFQTAYDEAFTDSDHETSIMKPPADIDDLEPEDFDLDLEGRPGESSASTEMMKESKL